jgi:phosphoglycolate phosphatase-like HAD superfamily hydrolase
MIIAIDLDGTIIDCRNRQSTLAASLFRAHVGPLDSHQYWILRRDGLSNKMALQALGCAPSIASYIDTAWRNYIESIFWLQLDRPISGAKEALCLGRQLGVKWALITARSSRKNLLLQLSTLGLLDSLSEICVVLPASAADSKSRILRELKPNAFIGDTESDFAASVLASVPFLGVASGQRSCSFLRRSGVNLVFPCFAEAFTHLSSEVKPT